MEAGALTLLQGKLLRKSAYPSLRGPRPEEDGVDAIPTNLRALRSDKRGATAIEYGLIVAVIVLAMVAGLRGLGGGVGGAWTQLADDVSAAM